jgi:hypothetical protein
MEEFIGLRSKLYVHHILENEKEFKKAKGIKKNVILKDILCEDYRKCLLTKEPIYKK